jgi:L-lactate utilization protein LutB
MDLSELKASLGPDEQVVGFYGVNGKPVYIAVPVLHSDSEVLAAVFKTRHGREMTRTEAALARTLENTVA